MAFPGGLVIKDLGTVTVAALVAAVAPGPSLVSGTPTCHRKGKRKRGGEDVGSLATTLSPHCPGSI